MPDTVSVTSHQSWFARIAKAIVGVLVGLVFCLVAVPLLWWNEGRAVHRARSLAEGARVVIDVPAERVSPENEGKLVHLTALATADGTVSDPDFGIAAPALRLRRIAETYQWRENSSSETRKKFGGGETTTKTYNYRKTWSSDHIDSGNFHDRSGHENPPALAWHSRTTTASLVACGAFALSPELVDKISSSQPRASEPDDERKMAARGFRPADEGYFYKGKDPSDPHIGDVRVRFEVVTPQTVSLVATQRGNSFESFHARAGSDILLLKEGQVSAAEMFRDAQTSNTITTWLIRGGGFLAMFLGLVLVLRPISVFASVVPLFGRMVGAGTALLAALLAAALSLATMALAWVAYRPLLGGGLLLAAVGAVVLIVRSRRLKQVVPPPIPTGVG